MPLNLSPLPTNLTDGGGGHTAGHNSANTAINAIAPAVDGLENRLNAIALINNVGNLSGSIAPSTGTSSIKVFTLVGNLTITGFSNPISMELQYLEFIITQGGTGSYTITWPSSVKWAGGVAPVLSTAVGAVDRLCLTSYTAAGTVWYGDLIGKGYA